MRKSTLLNRFTLSVWLILAVSTFSLPDEQSEQNPKTQLRTLAEEETAPLSDTTESQQVYLQPSIITFLKMYESKNDFCWYKCQTYNILDLFSCYQSLQCYESVTDDAMLTVSVFLYIVLPIFMIILGVWTPTCFARRLALFTGLVFVNSIYHRVLRQTQEDMETNYDVSTNSDVSSVNISVLKQEIKENDRNNQNQ